MKTAAGTLLVLLAGAEAPARADWLVELLTGSAYNFTTPLTIRQTALPELRLDGRYATRPFEGSPYAAVRIGRWRGPWAWEVQVLHHKLYLSYRTPEVERFEVTHGYNLVTLAYARQAGGWVVRAGAGVVIAHPESSIRGRTVVGYGAPRGIGQGVAGPTLELGLGRGWDVGRRWRLGAELKLTRSWAEVPVGDGDADVPNLAVHGLVSVGVRF